MKGSRHLANNILCGFYLDIGHAFGFLLRQVLAEHSLCSKFHGFGYKLMAVYLSSLHGYKEMTILDAARIDVNASDFYILIAYKGNHGDGIEQFLEFHISILILFFYSIFNTQVIPFFTVMPGPMLCATTFPRPLIFTFMPRLSIRYTASRAPIP